MDHTACTEPQCLYQGAFYLYFLHFTLPCVLLTWYLIEHSQVYLYIHTKKYILSIFVSLDRCVTRIWCHFAVPLHKPVASSFCHSLEYLDTVAANSEMPSTLLSSPSPVPVSPRSDTLYQLSLEEEKPSATGKSWCSKTMFMSIVIWGEVM